MGSEPQLQSRLQSWLGEALSEEVRAYKLRRLGEAFGLSQDYLSEYIKTGRSMGVALVIEIQYWLTDHWDLSPNSPAPDHPLSGVTTNDG